MRVTNQGSEPADHGQFGEWMRIQGEFQARLAEETLRYLRRLQGTFAPAAPGTVVQRTQGAPELTAVARAGASAELRVEVQNLQRVHCLVTPQLTALVSAAGATWFPAVTESSCLLAPEEMQEVVVSIAVPPALAAGTYRGALVLQGFDRGALPISVEVMAPDLP